MYMISKIVSIPNKAKKQKRRSMLLPSSCLVKILRSKAWDGRKKIVMEISSYRDVSRITIPKSFYSRLQSLTLIHILWTLFLDFSPAVLSRSATTTTIVIRIQGFRQTSPRLRWSRGWSANSVSFERLSRDRSLSLHARARRRRSYLHTRSSYLTSRLYSHCTKRSCRSNRFPLSSIFDSDRDTLWRILASLRWLPDALIL